MKKFTVFVSRYQSVAVVVEADNIELAEFIAEREIDGGFFYDYDDEHEVIDSYEADDQDEEASFIQDDNDLIEFKLVNNINS
jgi:hypothetical protein